MTPCSELNTLYQHAEENMGEVIAPQHFILFFFTIISALAVFRALAVQEL